MSKCYIAVMNPTHEEALALHHILDKQYKAIHGNKWGVKLLTWSRDKVEFEIIIDWSDQYFWAEQIAHRAAHQWFDEGHDENADISWGAKPQEYRNSDYWDVSPEDYAEWAAASCGKC